MRNTQRHFFEILFKTFEEKNLNYVVLHSWQTLPDEATSDVDMMISSDEKPRLEPLLFEVANRSGWHFVQKLWYDVPWCFYYVAVSPDGECSVALDFVSDPKGVGEYRIADEKILRHRKSDGLLYHLTTEAELAYKLAKRRVKGIFRANDLAFVNDYYARADKDILDVRMHELLPDSVCKELMVMMAGGASLEEYRKFMEETSPAFRLFGRRWRIKWNVSWFANQVIRIFNRLQDPTGVIVYGNAKISFPGFVFRRETMGKHVRCWRRMAVLSSATLLKVNDCALTGYDVGQGFSSVSCEDMRVRLYEDMARRLKMNRVNAK